VAYALGISTKEKLDRWLGVVALKIRTMVTWSLTILDQRWASAKARSGTSNVDAARVAHPLQQFKFWHLLALMIAVAVAAPLVVLHRSPILLGAICLFNALTGTVLVVKARNL
jgi:hypothetical protein